MATLHGLMDFYVGDTILIDVTVTDADGVELDLTTCDLEWKLNDPDGVNIETYSIRDGVVNGDFDLIEADTGRVAITVGGSFTASYAPGYYHDQLRVWVPDPGFEVITVTEMVGTILMRRPLSPGVAAMATSTLEVGSPVLDPGEIAGGMGG